ncbi:hypothetical protein [Psychrobacter immobilis]|uniref:hypothetical protein n=1 Tax=Psychrobacter immobilis TaxID=498 RepID=UPI0028EE0AB3|nr:hypothetical protein [Psychrobacter immobilis]
MKDANKRLEYNKSRQKINNESMINNTASKVGILKFTGVAALALGSVALATQNAQALSSMALLLVAALASAKTFSMVMSPIKIWIFIIPSH